MTYRSVSGLVRADPPAVWAVVGDVPRTAQWSAEVQSVDWDDPAAGPVVGAWFTAHNRAGDTTWDPRSVVTASVPGEVFAFAVSGVEHPTATWTWTLEAVTDGTQVTYAVELGDGPSMLKAVAGDDLERLARMTERRLEQLAAAMALTLDGVRAACER